MTLPRYKDIINLVKKGSTQEAKEKILELREAVLELQEENLELKEKLSMLKTQLQKECNMTFDGDFYWIGEGKKKEGPFCPKCFENRGLIKRIREQGIGLWCYECSTLYGGSAQK